MKLVKLENDGDMARLSSEGEITQQSLVPGHHPLVEALGPDVYGMKVLLSLEKTTYIDSSGISWLVIAQKHFMQKGGKLVIHSPPAMIDQVLRLLKMHLVLNLATDEAGARAMASDGKS
jgi:anti-anti-sigma factor